MSVKQGQVERNDGGRNGEERERVVRKRKVGRDVSCGRMSGDIRTPLSSWKGMLKAAREVSRTDTSMLV